MIKIKNTAKALIRKNDAVLLIRKFYSDENEELFTLPGGTQKPGESLTEALVRECMEEISVSPFVGELMYVHEYMRISSKNRLQLIHAVEFIFRCHVDDGYEPCNGPKPDPHQSDVMWVPLEHADKLIFKPLQAKQFLAGGAAVYQGKKFL